MFPVVARLAADGRACRSASTPRRPPSPAAALDAGATIVNDVSAGRLDPDILGVVADAGAGYVVMHMQGEPATMQADPRYDDVVAEVGDFLAERVGAARAAGVARRRDRAPTRASASARRSSTTSSCSPGCPTLAERVGVPVMVGRVAQDASSGRCSHERRRVGRLARRPARRGDAGDRRSGPSSGAPSIVRVHDVAAGRARPFGCSRDAEAHAEAGGGVKGRWAQGLEPRVLHVGHHGPAGGVASVPAASPGITARCGARRS